jgi:hypothetical protein
MIDLSGLISILSLVTSFGSLLMLSFIGLMMYNAYMKLIGYRETFQKTIKTLDSINGTAATVEKICSVINFPQLITSLAQMIGQLFTVERRQALLKLATADASTVATPVASVDATRKFVMPSSDTAAAKFLGVAVQTLLHEASESIASDGGATLGRTGAMLAHRLLKSVSELTLE